MNMLNTMNNSFELEGILSPFRTYKMGYFIPVVKTTGYTTFPFQGKPGKLLLWSGIKYFKGIIFYSTLVLKIILAATG